MKEYKLIETTKENAEKLMNNMAKHGWEVVSVLHKKYTLKFLQLISTLV